MPQKACAICVLYSLLAPPLSLGGQLIELNQSQSQATLLIERQPYTLALTPGIGKLIALKNRLVVFDRTHQELVWLSFFDLHLHHTLHPAGQPAAIDAAEISLAKEFAQGKVKDVAALEFPGGVMFILSQPSGPGKIAVKTLSFILPNTQSPSPSEATRRGIPDHSPPSPTPPVVAGLAGAKTHLLGQGLITVATHPQTGDPLLLSWDQEHHLLHEYRLSPQGEFNFQGSLQLPPIKQATLLTTDRAHHDKFYLIAGDKKHGFALNKLHIGRSLKRVELTSAVLNETGNAWTKELLFLGLANQAIDHLDQAFGNQWITTGQLREDEEYNPLAVPLKVKDTLEQLRSHRLITELEYQRLKREHFLESTQGKKWLAIASLLVGLYTWHKLKAHSPRLAGFHQESMDKIHSSLTRSLSLLGLSPTRTAKMVTTMSRAQRRFRGRLLRNHYNSQLPIHEIKKMERSLTKITRKLDTPEANKILDLITANKKTKDLQQRSQRLAELASSPQLDDIIDQFIQRFVLPSRVLQFQSKLKKKVDSLAESSRRIHQMGHYFGHQALKALSSVHRSPIKQLHLTMDKVATLERQVEVSRAVMRLKSEVLVFSKKVTKDLHKIQHKDIAGVSTEELNSFIWWSRVTAHSHSKQAVEYLNITGSKAILARATIAQKLAKQLQYSKKFTTLGERMQGKLQELGELDAIISNYTAKGKSHPFFDYWAKYAVIPYTRYFIPERFYQSQNAVGKKVSGWLKEYARRDYVKMPNGANEHINITGEHVRVAWGVGTADTTLDIATQYVARMDAIDPRERIWGDSPFHIDITPGQKTGGVHFDMVANTLLNALHFYLGMPVSYAKMNYNFGTSSTVSYFQRMKDGWIRGINPLNLTYATAQSWPVWWMSGQLALNNYRQKAGDDFDPKVFSELEQTLNNRLFKFRSVVERKVYTVAVTSTYVEPQYYMQQELDKVISKITGGPKASILIGSIIMPFTTGYFFHKWWADYFGASNPDMIKILKKFNADGVLDKIDKNGMTDLGTWTLHEATTYSTLITLFEMDKLEKELPFPQGYPGEIAKWYAMLYARLGRGHHMEQQDLPQILATKLKVRGSAGEKFEYAQQAKDLLNQLQQITTHIRQYPIATSRKKLFLLPVEKSYAQLLQQNLNASLDDAIKIQAKALPSPHYPPGQRPGFFPD